MNTIPLPKIRNLIKYGRERSRRKQRSALPKDCSITSKPLCGKKRDFKVITDGNEGDLPNKRINSTNQISMPEKDYSLARQLITSYD